MWLLQRFEKRKTGKNGKNNIFLQGGHLPVPHLPVPYNIFGTKLLGKPIYQVTRQKCLGTGRWGTRELQTIGFITPHNSIYNDRIVGGLPWPALYQPVVICVIHPIEIVTKHIQLYTFIKYRCKKLKTWKSKNNYKLIQDRSIPFGEGKLGWRVRN